MTPAKTGFWAAALVLAVAPFASSQEVPVAPPAHDWTLPLFTREGFRQMTLKGDEVHPVSSDRIDIAGLNVTVFSGGPGAKVDSVLLSPAATFLINEKIALGSTTVRLVRDDIDVTGEGWKYIYDEKRVIISKHAHVVFRAVMPDILK